MLQPDKTQAGRCLKWPPSPSRHPHPDMDEPLSNSARGWLLDAVRGRAGRRERRERAPGFDLGAGNQEQRHREEGLSQAGRERTGCNFLTLGPLVRERCRLADSVFSS